MEQRKKHRIFVCHFLVFQMLYFEKAELEAWLRQNPVKTQAQIEQEAQKYILNRPLKK